jgi:hypothetical protein
VRETVNDAYVGAGGPGSQGPTPGRALCLLDRLHRDGAITTEMWMAGTQLRQQIMAEMPGSEGIPSYGTNVKASEVSRKADRAGRRLTGFEIQPDGSVLKPGGKRSRSNLRDLEDALFAACGMHDIEHKRIADLKHVNILMRVCIESEDMPTLQGLGCELTHLVRGKDGKMEPYYGAKSKQTPPFAGGHIYVWLGRLAQHYRMAK